MSMKTMPYQRGRRLAQIGRHPTGNMRGGSGCRRAASNWQPPASVFARKTLGMWWVAWRGGEPGRKKARKTMQIQSKNTVHGGRGRGGRGKAEALGTHGRFAFGAIPLAGVEQSVDDARRGTDEIWTRLKASLVRKPCGGLKGGHLHECCESVLLARGEM